MSGEISFVSTEGDYVAARRDWFLLWLKSRRFALRLAAMASLSAAIGLVGALLDREPDLPATGIGFALLGVVTALVIYGLCYALLPVQARRLYRQQKSLQLPCRYSWSETHLEVESGAGTSRVAWSELHAGAAGRRTLLFFLNDELFFFLPRRLLSEGQVAELTALAGARPRL